MSPSWNHGKDGDISILEGPAGGLMDFATGQNQTAQGCKLLAEKKLEKKEVVSLALYTLTYSARRGEMRRRRIRRHATNSKYQTV